MRDSQREYDASLSLLRESDARMAGVAEQMAAAGQNLKNGDAEIGRLESSLREVRSAIEIDSKELAIARAEFGRVDEPQEPDRTQLENSRAALSTARAVEVEARLGVRTAEERVQSLAQRASELEQAALMEREAAAKSISRREARARGAITAQAIADAAYEALIQIENSISRANQERQRLETARTNRDGEILTIRAQVRDLSTE